MTLLAKKGTPRGTKDEGWVIRIWRTQFNPLQAAFLAQERLLGLFLLSHPSQLPQRNRLGEAAGPGLGAGVQDNGLGLFPPPTGQASASDLHEENTCYRMPGPRDHTLSLGLIKERIKGA